MVKRTLYFGNPAYLHTANNQLIAEINNPELNEAIHTIPIEDIGLLLIDHPQITITQALLAKLMESNVGFITCDSTHHPSGLMLSMEGNSLQTQKHQIQIAATVPLKKQLWQQTVIAKISNQATLLERNRIAVEYLKNLLLTVKSGDSGNCEAKAAVYYWKRIFPDFLEFRRERFGPPPNNLLNYGYAILRAIVARAIVSSGLLPTIGIFHRNQYNAFCLADDLMEPYRPYVDRIVCDIIRLNGRFLEITPAMKKTLLNIPAIDVKIDGKTSPLIVAVSRSSASLVSCYEGKSRKLLYPVL